MNDKSKKIIVGLVAIIIVAWVVVEKKISFDGIFSGSEEEASVRLGTDVEPIKYALDFIIDPRQERFSGHTEISLQFNKAQSFIKLHGANLNVTSLTLSLDDGTQVSGSYEQVDDTGMAKVSLDQQIPVGSATLVMDYDAPFNPSLEGIYKVVEGGESYAFTQYEATSARFAFPGFDEPEFKTTFDVTITIPSEQNVIANTPVVNEEVLDNGTTKTTFATTKPLPTYLLALAVGPLDIVTWEDIPATELRDRPIPLRAASAKGKGGRLVYALEETALMLTTLEEYFGTAYPYAKLDIIAVPDFSAGAMENAGAITYREQLLLLDENSSTRLKRGFISTHTHELAHMWFGDLVTPKWWDDIWLNESFATWMAAKALTIAHPDGNFGGNMQNSALNIMGSDSLITARQIRQPILSHHDIATAFDGITYSKGGAVLNMFENFLGEDDFREGIRLHMNRFAHSVADVYDFMSSLEDGSGHEGITSSFTSFISQPGLPFIAISNVTSDDTGVSLTVSQSRYLPVGSRGSTDSLWEIPVCLSFGVSGGSERRCTIISEKQQVVHFDDLSDVQYIHPNANGTGYYRWTLEDANWQNLLTAYGNLPVSERKSLYDAVSSSYAAGNASVETLMGIIDVVARDQVWDVANRARGTLSNMERYAPEAAREGIRAYIGELFSPALANIGLWPYTAADAAEPSQTSLKRSAVVSSLAITARHVALRADLASMAKAYVGLDDGGAINPSAINSDLVGTALVVGVEELGTDFVEQLFAHLSSSTDAVLRQRILGALTYTKDEAVLGRVFDLIGSEDIRDNEAIAIYFGLSSREGKSDAVWAWLHDNKDVIVDRIPTWRKGAIVFTVRSWCDASRIDEFKAFFDPIIGGLEGGPKQFAQVVERLELCSSFKELRAPELEAQFSAN